MINPSGDYLEAVFYPLDIQRVLQNLIINAGFVTETGGMVEIGASRNNSFLQISVTDKGTGIPEDIKNYLSKIL